MLFRRNVYFMLLIGFESLDKSLRLNFNFKDCEKYKNEEVIFF